MRLAPADVLATQRNKVTQVSSYQDAFSLRGVVQLLGV
jgi:hypothetical protein